MLARAVIAVLVGYLLGSVSFAILLVWAARGSDVRTMGSGNAGATNVLRSAGRGLAMTTLALDVLKGALAVVVPALLKLPVEAQAAAGVAAVAGHVFPVWFGFRGGKGVATAGGAFLLLSPLSVAALVVGFSAVVSLSRYVSLGSVVCALLLPVALLALGEDRAVILAGAAVAAVLVYSHRANLRRLLEGTERRIGRGEGS